MRLAIGRSTRHRRAHARCDAGVEKIDVEADMQYAVAGPDALYDAADQYGDAEFVNLAHVDDPDPARAHQLLFELVDPARAEEVEPVGIDRGARIVAQQSVEAGFAAKECRRHAV